MKIQYTCEVCGKTYNSEPRAQKCELKHKEAERRKILAAHQEQELLKAINDATNLYVENYGRLPILTLTEVNQERLLDEMSRLIFGTTNMR